MRYRLKKSEIEKIFTRLSSMKITKSQISNKIGVSTRTLNDWQNARHTIPGDSFNKLLNLAGIEKCKVEFEELSDWWNNSAAGEIGGTRRFEKYGKLGTKTSRKKGGLSSYEKRKDINNDIFTRKAIKEPDLDKKLAEFVGIMIGDGSMNKYQASIALSNHADKEYADYVLDLIVDLFDINGSKIIREKSNCIIINISSIETVRYLHKIGILKGDKIKQGLDMPSWVLCDYSLVTSCIKGIFDTDGSIYYERHIIKDKVYSYPRISIVSASHNLLSTIRTSLERLEMKPKIRNNRSVNLESRAEIEKFFEIIGSSNPKHLSRYYGGVG